MSVTRYRCSWCGEVKAEEFFYRMTYRPGKNLRPVMYWCIRCCRAYKSSHRNVEYDRARRRLQRTSA